MSLFVKKMFIATMASVGCGTLISLNPLKSVSTSNEECKVRPVIVNINSN